MTFLEGKATQIMEWGIGSDRLGWIPVNMHWSKHIALYSTRGQSEFIQIYLLLYK